MIEKLDDALFANDDIIFINEDKNYYKVGEWLRVGKVGIRWQRVGRSDQNTFSASWLVYDLEQKKIYLYIYEDLV